MSPEKIIIDTDPGVDDILAISLALNNPDKLEVLLLTVSHGNVAVELCHRNLVTLLGILEKEHEFRAKHGLKRQEFGNPLVASGAGHPLKKEHAHGELDPNQEWEGFHGVDGLNGVYFRMPELILDDNRVSPDAPFDGAVSNFVLSARPAHVEILNQLREHEPKSITIVVIGPCTNVALAALEDPVTFARAKKIVIMGGAVRVPGNQTPRAEFNIYADPDAAAVIFNLTQLANASTPLGQLDVVLVPVDITSSHVLTEDTWKTFSKDLIVNGSPLAIFLDNVLGRTFEKMNDLIGASVFGCHDPLTIYALLESIAVEFEHGLDIRVETDGIWTRGETVLDMRGAVKLAEGQESVIRDNGGWFSGDKRNSLSVLKSSGVPGEAFGLKLLEGIFN